VTASIIHRWRNDWQGNVYLSNKHRITTTVFFLWIPFKRSLTCNNTLYFPNRNEFGTWHHSFLSLQCFTVDWPTQVTYMRYMFRHISSGRRYLSNYKQQDLFKTKLGPGQRWISPSHSLHFCGFLYSEVEISITSDVKTQNHTFYFCLEKRPYNLIKVWSSFM
jgi:hypothetical protein